MNIQKLLALEESKTLEFKRDLSSTSGILKTIIAFANTAGGIILIGIDDKTKHIRGIDTPLKNEERLASLISDNIHPQILPSIDIISFNKTQLISIEVFPSTSSPHFLNKKGLENSVYIRVGSTNRLADQQTIQEIKRVSTSKCFDEEPLPTLSPEALDFRLASEYFSEFKSLKNTDMETLSLLIKYQGKTVPTVGGLLLFGKEREKYFPDSWIKAGSFQGNDKSKILNSLDIHNNLIDSITDAINFIDKNLFHEFNIGKIRHQVKSSIPQTAIREAMINAIVHADYSQQGSPIRIAIFNNRIEIENPGLLRFGLTIEDIKNGVSKLRNRVIGRVFSEIGLIEQWGSGIQRIISVCKESGNRPPIFEEIGTHFRVTLFSDMVECPATDTTDNKIIGCIDKSNNKSLSTQSIASEIKLSTRATRMRLRKLVDKGLLAEIATSPNDPNKKYILTKRSLDLLK